MTITTVGIDLAKNVFQVYGVDERGKTTLKKQLKRAQVAEFFCNTVAKHRRDASLWQRSPLAPQAAMLWPNGAVDGAAVRQAVCQDQ